MADERVPIWCVFSIGNVLSLMCDIVLICVKVLNSNHLFALRVYGSDSDSELQLDSHII